MKVLVVSVGKVKGTFAAPVAEYEKRVGRYFSFEAHAVREEAARGDGTVDRVLGEEGRRLLARVPAGVEIVAMHREGQSWNSDRLSRYLTDLAVHGSPGAAFLIGGAYGLSEEVLGSARHLLSLSAFTMPHELARLVLTEQLYRAGTIARGEPYHKRSRSGPGA